MRGYLQATLKECRKALASHNTGLHARARVDEAKRFMGDITACTEIPHIRGRSVRVNLVSTGGDVEKKDRHPFFPLCNNLARAFSALLSRLRGQQRNSTPERSSPLSGLNSAVGPSDCSVVELNFQRRLMTVELSII